MQALGQLSPLEDIQAQIENYAGQFLQYKSKLIALQGSPSLQISSKASALLTTQNELENEIQNALSDIDQMKTTGAWDFSKIISYGDLISRTTKQINDVNDLLAQAGGVVPSSGFSIGALVMFSLLVSGGVLVAAYVSGK